MKPKSIKDSSSTSSPSQEDDSGPSEVSSAVAKIAVAQICMSVGYRAAEKTALETLMDVAVRYLRSLAMSAATSAASSGRTQSNLLDIVRALEDLHSGLGFRGNSESTRHLHLLSNSSVLCDTMKFVNRTREVPFAKPLPRRRRRRHAVPSKRPRSFDYIEGSKWNHIPRWLPAFPKVDDGGTITVIAASDGEIPSEKKTVFNSIVTKREASDLPEKRKKVSFKINGVYRREKNISLQINNDDEDENVLNVNSSNNHNTHMSMKDKLKGPSMMNMAMMRIAFDNDLKTK